MITLKIVTPQGETYSNNNIKLVTLPTQTGIITVLEDHEPIVTLLQAGEIIISNTENEETHLAVSTGMVEVRKDSAIYILADTAERADDIDIARAQEAKKRAEEYLKKQENIADVDFARIQAKIQKEVARIQVGKKYKKLPNMS